MPHVDQARLSELIDQARASARRRTHLNVHGSYDEHCQRLLIAMERDSYIRPHQHPQSSTNESLVALRGRFMLLTLGDSGTVVSAAAFGADWGGLVVCDVPPDMWHTVVCLDSGGVLFEAKAGPYDAENAKSFAPFAPAEGTLEASVYLERLRDQGLRRLAQLTGTNSVSR